MEKVIAGVLTVGKNAEGGDVSISSPTQPVTQRWSHRVSH